MILCKAMADQEEIFLNDVWSLYFHDPDQHDWSEASYIRLCDISSVDDLIHIYKAYKDLFQYGNFFFMREFIKPMWEDPMNRNGGCMSFKIMKYDIQKIWFEIVSKILGETFVIEPKRKKLWSQVTGISISPKRSYSIARIWISDRTYGLPDLYDMSIIPTYTQVLFKEHTENKDFVVQDEKEATEA